MMLSWVLDRGYSVGKARFFVGGVTRSAAFPCRQRALVAACSRSGEPVWQYTFEAASSRSSVLSWQRVLAARAFGVACSRSSTWLRWRGSAFAELVGPWSVWARGARDRAERARRGGSLEIRMRGSNMTQLWHRMSDPHAVQQCVSKLDGAGWGVREIEGSRRSRNRVILIGRG